MLKLKPSGEGKPLTKHAGFNPHCRLCPRLAGFLDQVQAKYPDYHARPVAAFGDADPALLIVGLAPGMHGANATGRPFTGDHAGIILYKTLFELGFSNHPESVSRTDNLLLTTCRITNSVKCLPPQNKPLTSEVITCNAYLKTELKQLRQGAVILALGTIAHASVLRALGLKAGAYKFGHALHYALPNGLILVDSYHCSRYNLQTRRLTPAMFKAVFELARKLMRTDEPLSI